MPHLDRLTPYLRGPATLKFPQMQLLARDNEPLLAIGAGTFSIPSEREFTFELAGAPVDLGHTLRALNRLREDPYEPLNRFRLQMTDADGVSWWGGWTTPSVNTDGDVWRFTGDCDGLSTDLSGPAGDGGSEVRILIPRSHPASLSLSNFVRTAGPAGTRSPHRIVQVMGEPVRFDFDRENDVLTLSTPLSETFAFPFAENWLGEPIRILFGQLAFPRLVERRFPDGRAMLSVRRTATWTRDSTWTALWLGDDMLTNAEAFFDLYAGLLTLVVRRQKFEAHTVTKFYEEVIQAARGSRWVSTMTLASSIEGLARLLTPADTRRADADPAAIEGLVGHIQGWPGSARLKNAAADFVRRLDGVSVQRALLSFAAAGVGSRDQVKSWIKVRNVVMHGGLVSPYSTQKEDEILVRLADLLRALTREAVRRALVAGHPGSVPDDVASDPAT